VSHFDRARPADRSIRLGGPDDPSEIGLTVSKAQMTTVKDGNDDDVRPARLVGPILHWGRLLHPNARTGGVLCVHFTFLP
jgi:hypothetical protein